jgi:hypothetical protein
MVRKNHRELRSKADCSRIGSAATSGTLTGDRVCLRGRSGRGMILGAVSLGRAQRILGSVIGCQSCHTVALHVASSLCCQVYAVLTGDTKRSSLYHIKLARAANRDT